MRQTRMSLDAYMSSLYANTLVFIRTYTCIYKHIMSVDVILSGIEFWQIMKSLKKLYVGNEQPSRSFPSFKNANFRKKEEEKAFFFFFWKVVFYAWKGNIITITFVLKHRLRALRKWLRYR